MTATPLALTTDVSIIEDCEVAVTDDGCSRVSGLDVERFLSTMAGGRPTHSLEVLYTSSVATLLLFREGVLLYDGYSAGLDDGCFHQ